MNNILDCSFFFFNNKEVNFESILKHITVQGENYRIITTSITLNEFLIKNGKNSTMIGDFLSNTDVEHSIYLDSKKILENYRKFFHDITFKKIEIFLGVNFQFLLQLTTLMTIKKILEDKKNTIFIYDRFYSIFFVVPKLSLDLGYITEMKIGFFEGSKLEFINCDEDQTILKYVNKFSRGKVTNFLMYSLGEGFSLDKLKMLTRFVVNIISLNLKKIRYRVNDKTRVDPIQTILKKVEKKIKNVNNVYLSETAFFITAARLDLYLRPFLPVLNKFILEKKNCLVFTGDVTTSLALKKEKIEFVDLFEEVNLLTEHFKKSEEGQKIFQQLKEMIHNGNNLPYGITYIQDDLFNKFFRSIATISILEHIFEKTKLKSVVGASTTEMFENLAIEVSKKYNIPSYSMIPGVLASNSSIFSDWFRADKIFVNGIQGLEVLMKLGYDKERILVTGNPKYDYLKTFEAIKARVILEKNHQIDPKKNLVVIAMSRWHEGDEEWISKFIKFCNNNNFEIVIKVHPRYKIVGRDISENKIKSIQNKNQKLNYLINYDIDLPTLLSGADLLITDFSSVGLEAILLEKPVITVNFTNLHIDPNVRFYDYDASLYVKDYENLEKTIMEIFKEKKHLDKLRIGRKKIIERYNFQNDGLATDRVYEILTR